jgi:shikimate kinase / 3-dehydroquinate synthase
MSGSAAGARALVFIGFMGAGKSSAAAQVAGALGVPALDSDQLLQERFGQSIAERFEQHGEQAFRAEEEQLVCELLERADGDSVIALGGGAVLSPRVREALRAHTTVLLEVDTDTAWERVRRSSRWTRRPLADDRAAFAALHDSRRGLYEELADALLSTSTAGVALRALPALAMLAVAPPGTRMLWASAASGEYPVFIGQGVLDSDIWPLDRSSSRGFCVTDELVAPLHAARLRALQTLIAIPAGERHKTLHSAERVWRELVAAGMTRADHVVALGGGVVGDLAGFCAAAYQRGVPIVQVPTTLMAQVDSAYGGKTGVDLPEGKNFVGVYHQPAGVIVDSSTLSTLPAAELSAGYVEVLKTALIAGGELWERVAAGAPVDEQMIVACARTKLAVVDQDERDAGRRQVLNLGHTVGHAIETTTNYSRYRHGEAVGLGLLAALRLSGLPELREQVRELLLANGLPVEVQGVQTEQILAATTRDKKRIGAHVPFVLVRAPGDVRVGCEVAERELSASVAELVAA